MLSVMEGPCQGVEEADQGRFADAPFEERIRGQSAEGVVANFGVGRRRATVD